MEDYGHASPHQLRVMTLRASQGSLQKILQTPEIENMPNFIQRPVVEGERLSFRKLIE